MFGRVLSLGGETCQEDLDGEDDEDAVSNASV